MQEAFEVRVVAVVEDDEPGVNVMSLVRQVDPDRVGMTPDVLGGFKHRDVVAFVQQMGDGQT